MKKMSLTKLIVTATACAVFAASGGAVSADEDTAAEWTEWISYTTEDGDQYEGYARVSSETLESGATVLHRVPDGYGIMQFADGSIYTGNWEEGITRGFGIETSSSGSKFVGYYNYMGGDGADGYGVWYDENGDIGQYGLWADGVLSEGACETWLDSKGNIFVNVDEDGNGYGMRIDTDNIIRFGNFEDGLLTGQGVIVLDNGDWASGEFANDTYNGFVVYYFASGVQRMGHWTNGVKDGAIVQINVDDTGRGFFARIYDNGDAETMWVNVGGDENGSQVTYGDSLDDARTYDGENTMSFTTTSSDVGILLFTDGFMEDVTDGCLDGKFFIGIIEDSRPLPSEGTLFVIDNPGEFYTGTFVDGALYDGYHVVPSESTLKATEYRNGVLITADSGAGTTIFEVED